MHLQKYQTKSEQKQKKNQNVQSFLKQINRRAKPVVAIINDGHYVFKLRAQGHNCPWLQCKASKMDRQTVYIYTLWRATQF